MKSLFEKLGAKVATNEKSIQRDIIETLEVHSNILRLMKGTVELVSNGINFETTDVKRLKGFPLSKETMQTAVPILSLQIYINPCLFWLSNLSFIMLAGLKLINEARAVTKDAIFNTFKELSAIFYSEFILANSFEDNFKVLLDLEIFHKVDEYFVLKLKHISNVILSAFAPFLCIYLQIANTILDQVNLKILF